MDYTAKSLSDMARAELDGLSASKKYSSDSAMYEEIAKLADLSRQTVRQFRIGLQPNLSIANLDKLVAAIKAAKRLRAA